MRRSFPPTSRRVYLLIPLQLGLNAWTPYGNYFTGNLNQVRIYDSALAASDVSALYTVDDGGGGTGRRPFPSPLPPTTPRFPPPSP